MAVNPLNLFRHPQQLKDLTPEALSALVGQSAPPLLLDVRTNREYAKAHISGAVSMPLGTEHTAVEQYPKDGEVVLICKTGHRSQAAAITLLQAGFTNVSHLQGGMDAWRRTHHPTV